jgi:hypothetical protein
MSLLHDKWCCGNWVISNDLHYYSFCSKAQDEVDKLITKFSDGLKAFICNECIELCGSATITFVGVMEVPISPLFNFVPHQ